jgi:AraC family transcriptional regulator
MAESLQLTLPTSMGVAIYPPGATFGPRPMRDFEFVWMIQGDGEYRWGDRTVSAPEGSILLCTPGAEDFFRWDPRRRTRHGFFHFKISRYPRAWGTPDTWPLVRTAIEGDLLRPLFRHLLTWRQGGDSELALLTMRCMLTAYVLGQHASNELPQDVLPAAVEAALGHIQAKLDATPGAAIALAELAEAAAVTPEHLCRLFKSSIGRSPVETVRLARLDRAAILLARSNYAVKQIADMLGFSSPFHFSRRFSEAFGRSPRMLRKQVQSGMLPPLPLLLRSNVSHRTDLGRTNLDRTGLNRPAR